MLVKAIHALRSQEGETAPGDVVELEDAEAQRLIERGAVEAVAEAKPAKGGKNAGKPAEAKNDSKDGE